MVPVTTKQITIIIMYSHCCWFIAYENQDKNHHYQSLLPTNQYTSCCCDHPQAPRDIFQLLLQLCCLVAVLDA